MPGLLCGTSAGRRLSTAPHYAVPCVSRRMLRARATPLGSPSPARCILAALMIPNRPGTA